MRKWKDRTMRGKLLIALVVIGIIGIPSGLAIWVMSLSTSTINAMVTSSESSDVLSFSVALSDIGILDATNEDISEITIGEILNNNGDLTNFNVTINDIITDLNDSCINNDDITTEWKISDVVVNNGDSVDLNAGTTSISWNVSAVQSACPTESITGQLSLSQ